MWDKKEKENEKEKKKAGNSWTNLLEEGNIAESITVNSMSVLHS